MSTTKRTNLLQNLLNVSEKASNIARICRSNPDLLALLVQEKIGKEANARFEHDFKTLADVLIQETIRYDIGKMFPEMLDAIKGEESPNFTNKDNDSVTIVVGPTEDDTAKCLTAVLHGYENAAEILANEVHRNVVVDEQQIGEIPEMPTDLNYSNLGIWIDPIDGTAEYITGDSIFTNFPGITSTGLDCVTVLIGVYDLSTGEPRIGIISQPFHNKINENNYKSLIFWGVSLPAHDLQANNCPTEIPIRTNHFGIFSSSENSEILQRILRADYQLAFSAGAGHKALKVITWEVDLYLLSKDSTFKWDTCAPQAILRSLCGDIFDYKESLKQQTLIPVNYLMENNDDKNWKCNEGGLIAIRDLKLAEELLKILSIQ